MASFPFDPRGDLPASVVQPLSLFSRPDSVVSRYEHRRSSTYGVPPAFPKRQPCFDWIFSSASNCHVAIDRSAFTNYTAFKTYVLTVADQRRVSVKGIGTVVLKLRRRPGSKDTHKIELENVLHIPGWLCNIISDVYFRPAKDFEHNWTEFGLNLQKREEGVLRPWGFTENFCGLDRIVLGRNAHGRSPMLEDKDREVFSVNVAWSQSQQDKWNTFVAEKMKETAARHEAAVTRSSTLQPNKAIEFVSPKKTNRASVRSPVEEMQEPRRSLSEVNSNIKLPSRNSSLKAGNLKVSSSSRSALKDVLPWRHSIDK